MTEEFGTLVACNHAHMYNHPHADASCCVESKSCFLSDRAFVWRWSGLQLPLFSRSQPRSSNQRRLTQYHRRLQSKLRFYELIGEHSALLMFCARCVRRLSKNNIGLTFDCASPCVTCALLHPLAPRAMWLLFRDFPLDCRVRGSPF